MIFTEYPYTKKYTVGTWSTSCFFGPLNIFSSITQANPICPILLSHPPIICLGYLLFFVSPISYLWHIQQGLAGKTSILSYRAIEWPFFPPHKPSGHLKSYISSRKLFGQRFRLHCLVFCIKCLYILKDGDTLQKVEKLDELMIALMKEIRKQHFY